MSLADKFPVSTANATNTLRYHAGIKSNFKVADAQTRANVSALIVALTAYDANPTDANITPIMTLLTSLNMVGIRLQENSNALVLFSKDVVQNQQGDGITLFWKIGKVSLREQPSTYNNPYYNSILSNAHVGKDVDNDLATALFLNTNMKAMLCNGVAFGSSQVPCPCQKSFHQTDAAHCDVPLYYTAMQQLVTSFPGTTMTDLHGFTGTTNVNGVQKEDQQRVIISNNYDNQFLNNGQVSWPLLYAIALAQQNVNPHTVAFGSSLPGSIVDSTGNTVPLIGAPTVLNSFFIRDITGVVSDIVPGHLANGGNCNSRGNNLDRDMFMEVAPEYKQPGALLNCLVNAYEQALEWYLKYDPTKHNIWTLPPEITANMRKYPAYFQQMLQKPAANPSTKPVLSEKSKTVMFSATHHAKLSEKSHKFDDVVVNKERRSTMRFGK